MRFLEWQTAKGINYKVWKEGGITLDFVLEISSETTQAKDQ